MQVPQPWNDWGTMGTPEHLFFKLWTLSEDILVSLRMPVSLSIDDKWVIYYCIFLFLNSI